MPLTMPCIMLAPAAKRSNPSILALILVRAFSTFTTALSPNKTMLVRNSSHFRAAASLNCCSQVDTSVISCSNIVCIACEILSKIAFPVASNVSNIATALSHAPRQSPSIKLLTIPTISVINVAKPLMIMVARSIDVLIVSPIAVKAAIRPSLKITAAPSAILISTDPIAFSAFEITSFALVDEVDIASIPGDTSWNNQSNAAPRIGITTLANPLNICEITSPSAPAATPKASNIGDTASTKPLIASKNPDMLSPMPSNPPINASINSPINEVRGSKKEMTPSYRFCAPSTNEFHFSTIVSTKPVIRSGMFWKNVTRSSHFPLTFSMNSSKRS